MSCDLGNRRFIMGSRLTVVTLALEPGELVKDGYFSLMDSVASIEVSLALLRADCALDGVTDSARRSWTPRWTAAALPQGRHWRRSMM